MFLLLYVFAAITTPPLHFQNGSNSFRNTKEPFYRVIVLKALFHCTYPLALRYELELM